MSYSNYKSYNQFKGFHEKLRGVFVCRSGDSMTGNLNMTCNDILNVKNLSFCSDGKINGDVEFTNNVVINGNLEVSGNVLFIDISVNNLEVFNNLSVDGTAQLNDVSINNLDILNSLSLNCNLINDVSGIFFCDETYIGHGDSFDISTNEVLHIKTSQNVLIDGDTLFNNNVEIAGNLTVRGTTTQVSTQQLFIKDNVIEINQTMDASGNVDPSGVLPNPTDFQSGFVVYRGPDPLALDPSAVRLPYQFIYDESSNTFQIGISGEMQPVATREDVPTDNGVAVWDASTNRFVTDRGINIDISGNLSLNCNLLNDVSGINFCDGTYIGHGDSFDISANDVLVLSGVQDVCGNYNGASIVSKNRIYQQLNHDASWNSVNGYLGLSKDAYPALNPKSFGEKLVSEWVVSPLDTSNNLWQSVVWSPELELFVAVGSNTLDTSNNVMTSRNGINWTYGITPDSKFYRSITWSPQLNLFVAVSSSDVSGNFQRVITSPDGFNWTLRNTPDTQWWNVCWSAELGLFVAVARFNATLVDGSGNLVMTSPDGENWTPRQTPANYGWSSVVWSAELGIFVAVANDTINSNDKVMTSPDGINWTLQNTPYNRWNTLAWSPELGMFVALAAGGSPVGTTDTKAMSSPDGINWTIRSTANSPFQLNYGQVIWIAEVGLFVAVAPGTNGSNNRYIGYSSNGVNWSFTNRLPNTNNYGSIAWSPELGMLVAMGASPATNNEKALYIRLKNRLPTSYNVFDSSFNNIDNSGNWTIKAKELYGDNLLINSNVDISGNLSMNNNLINDVSGINFSDGSYIGSGSSFDISANDVLVLSGIQDVCGNYNGASVVSKNRVYQQLNPDPSWNAVNGYVGLAKDSYPALNPYSSGEKAVSTWTVRTTPPSIANPSISNNWRTVCWSPELRLFVAGAFSGGTDRIMTSPDGINWTVGNIDASNNIAQIVWSPELRLFVATCGTTAGINDKVFISSDGFVWNSPSDISYNNNLGPNCWSPELRLFVALATAGGSDRVLTSSDGESWTPRNSGTGFLLTNCNNDIGNTIICDSTAGLSVGMVLFIVDGSGNVPNNTRVSVIDSPTSFTTNDFISDLSNTTLYTENEWRSICWSAELGLFVAVSSSGTDRVMTSSDGINWTSRNAPVNSWFSICWSAELGLFVAVSNSGTDRVMTSSDGINWTSRNAPVNSWFSVCWSAELGLFVAGATGTGGNNIMTSPDGINWKPYTTPVNNDVFNICWSAELGIFVTVGFSGTLDRAMTSSLAGRPPTSYNVFDSSFNRIDEQGNWTYGKRVKQELNPDPSWNAVNGYYGLAKDAYPALNPYSSGVQAVSTWTVRTAAANNNWRSICWSAELGIFVAVSDDGSGNRVMTSPDGINWTSQTSAANNDWRYVVWSPELGIFVAVSFDGSGNRVMTSSDGITWTSQTSAVDNNWLGLCWSPELSLFVAVADSGGTDRVMTSSNGINWFSQTTPNQDFTSVCWSPELGLFVAVARSGTGNRVMTSPDGINWTSRITPVDNNWRSVCWSPELGLFVAVPQQGGGSVVMTSTDGINWILRPSSTADESWFQVIWAAELGLFVAVATTGGSDRIMTSPDGINWTLRPSGFGIWSSICWSPELGILVAVAFGVASGTTRVITSSLAGRPPTSYNVFDSSFNRIDEQGNWTYGKRVKQELNPDPSWNAVNGYYGLSKDAYPALNPYSSSVQSVSKWDLRSSASSNNWRGVCWSPELRLFVAVAFSGVDDRVMTSPDGINWTSRSITGDASGNGWRTVVWSRELGLFAAVAIDGGALNNLERVMTSPDGINWTSYTYSGAGINDSWRSIVWSAELGLFVAIASAGNKRVLTSPDGINWDLQDSPLEGWHGLTWSPELGIFVAVGITNGKVMTSPDGINWTLGDASSNRQWFSVCWSPELGLFVASAITGDDKRIMISSDGINWSPSKVPILNNWQLVIWSAELGLFVAVSSYSSIGGAYKVITSPDGINWTLRKTGIELTNCNNGSGNTINCDDTTGLTNGMRIEKLSGLGNVPNNTTVASIVSSTSFTTNNTITDLSNTTLNADNSWLSICWSPELGIFVAVAFTGTGNRVMTSSLAGRPPTSYNVFDSSFNNIDQSGNWTIKAKEIYGDNLLVNSNVDITGNLDLNCNLLNDVSGINFCNGTYIGHGDSFDISASDVLVLSGIQDVCGNYNGASIVTKDRLYQQLNQDASWNAVNGYLGLVKR
jgi:hypothetical protein